ncbi:MAG TPA: YggS family pyridoxal phosphate-dependent enzyme [Thermomicrobiaceae bacterium]|nr:YggS family pyridoxal phosphate-dependent enzyme [Thermomicrobiaceae bacterium]
MVERDTLTTVGSRLADVRGRVEAAALSSGRDPASVRIVGVTKTVGRDAVDDAYQAGLRDFGENRVQDSVQKFSQPLPADAVLHLIGYLQTNKVRDAVALFDVVHSLDRIALADGLQHRAAVLGKTLTVLLQVNVAREEQKHGCAPDDTLTLLNHALTLPSLRVVGLMTIAPLVADPEAARPVFGDLRRLRDDLVAATGSALPELSMGMTNDFEVAIAEGATMVRIGRAIFA